MKNIMTKLRGTLIATGVLAMTTMMASAEPALTYTTYGDGPEKVIFLHSWLADEHTLDTVKSFLDTDTFTYVLPNLRGYGRSKGLTGDYTSIEAATDVFNLADTLQWKQFHLIGHSMSGVIIQRAALINHENQSNRLKSVIGISPVTADGLPADEETKSFLLSTVHQPELAEHLVGNVLTGGRLPTNFIKMVVANNIATSSAEAMKGYYEMWINEDFSKKILAAKMKTPIMAISGSHDYFGFKSEHYANTFGKWYPNLSLVNFEDAGHLSMFETPLQLVSAIEGFMSKNK